MVSDVNTNFDGDSSRFRRMSSRMSSFSYDEPETLDISGEATLCFFNEAESGFQGVIITDDGSHFSIQGKKTNKKKGASLNCRCLEPSLDTDDDGVPVLYDLRIRDHDNPSEYFLKRVHGRNGQICKFTCSAVQFSSVSVYRGQRAAMMAQECLGRITGSCNVYQGPINITVLEKKEEPRHWVL